MSDLNFPIVVLMRFQNKKLKGVMYQEIGTFLTWKVNEESRKFVRIKWSKVMLVNTNMRHHFYACNRCIFLENECKIQLLPHYIPRPTSHSSKFVFHVWAAFAQIGRLFFKDSVAFPSSV